MTTENNTVDNMLKNMGFGQENQIKTIQSNNGSSEVAINTLKANIAETLLDISKKPILEQPDIRAMDELSLILSRVDLIKTSKGNSFVQGIIDFNKERKLSKYNKEAEIAMLTEELQELKESSTQYESVDALCDIIVLATGALYKLGFDPEKAMQETISEISSRKGSFNENTGKWEKDVTQDPNSLYKADYINAILPVKT